MHCAYCDMRKGISQPELTLTVALAIMELWHQLFVSQSVENYVIKKICNVS